MGGLPVVLLGTILSYQLCISTPVPVNIFLKGCNSNYNKMLSENTRFSNISGMMLGYQMQVCKFLSIFMTLLKQIKIVRVN
jgi:hypothetical protein